ncbi:EF-hand calcium-binding domain-containing protein 1, partial [Elysia marginata]
MSTFDEIRRITNALAKDVSDFTGVKASLVVNVIQYARRLSRPTNPDVIEELVFIAQMGQRFGITSLFHVKLMFDAIRIKDTKLVRVEEYVKLICIFYSKNLDVKIDFVFSVYDFYHDHQISPNEMTALLKTAIVSSGEDDAVEQLKELIEMVLLEFDSDKDGLISLEEFSVIVSPQSSATEDWGKLG